MSTLIRWPRRCLPAVLILFAGCAPPPAAQPGRPSPGTVGTPATLPTRSDTAFDLSVASIMRGEALVGRSPDEVRWSADSRFVYFRWREPTATDSTTSVFRVAVPEGHPVRLAEDSVPPSASTSGAWAADGSARAVLHRGDVWVITRDGRELRVTQTGAAEREPHLSPSGDVVYFLASGDLFAMPLDSGPLRQLTDFRTEEAPEESEPEGQRGFLSSEQERLFGSVRDRVAERRREEEREEEMRVVRPTYLGESARVTQARVSPSGRHALIGVATTAEPRSTTVADFVTESGYTEELIARPKVGDAQPSDRAAMVNLQTGELTWIEPEPLERDLAFRPIGWAPAEDRALLLAFAADHKDRWILAADSSGATTRLHHLRDDAWVGGPGLYTAGWLPDGSGVYFVSEESGFAHLYTATAGPGAPRPLTSGAWEVHQVQPPVPGQPFFITTNESHPGERHLYALPGAGGTPLRITTPEGWNEGVISPDGRWAAIVNSRANRPPELYLQPTDGDAARQVTISTTPEFERGPWIEPEIVLIPARDGANVPARIYRPRDVGAEPNGAAVLFVHGAGYLQNAHRGWSSYFREYMFNHLLASRGYVVLDLDYRASAGYGRDWRTAIHGSMGGQDLTDQVDAAAWLVEREGVDPERVGIYGGSYGGFITLMALFTEPEVFRSGAALRSVTDWAHYNHSYTSRILGRPQDEPDAYRRSSPIYHAEGLQGDLLIAHGMLDVNVQFQDVVRLVQRLIELEKTGWELAVYPVEGHAFVRPESWIDEYRRVLALFERTLRE